MTAITIHWANQFGQEQEGLVHCHRKMQAWSDKFVGSDAMITKIGHLGSAVSFSDLSIQCVASLIFTIFIPYVMGVVIYWQMVFLPLPSICPSGMESVSCTCVGVRGEVLDNLLVCVLCSVFMGIKCIQPHLFGASSTFLCAMCLFVKCTLTRISAEIFCTITYPATSTAYPMSLLTVILCTLDLAVVPVCVTNVFPCSQPMSHDD